MYIGARKITFSTLALISSTQNDRLRATMIARIAKSVQHVRRSLLSTQNDNRQTRLSPGGRGPSVPPLYRFG